MICKATQNTHQISGCYFKSYDSYWESLQVPIPPPSPSLSAGDVDFIFT